MESNSVAIISKDESLVHAVKTSLGLDGFDITDIPDFTSLPRPIPGAVILDASASGEFNLCRRLHEDFSVPILVLARGGDAERIKALSAGADDCMTKPINTVELVARIRKIVGRAGAKAQVSPQDKETLITLNNLYIDPARYQVKVDNREIKLTVTEFNLLLVLARQRGKVVTRQELLDQVWGNCRLQSDRTINVHVCRLRRKIEPDSHWPRRLVLVRGRGYKLER
ncbi:MAG: response regulator transcription factor [Chloroflexi bacterium]|nr:response regulator transcription factor [Chloroflexota bacterium]